MLWNSARENTETSECIFELGVQLSPLILPDSYIGENSGINLSTLEVLSENAKSFIKEIRILLTLGTELPG